ncbi:MAG: DDE-type integrase/transposase/recombinase [Planctomycetota bacterium]
MTLLARQTTLDHRPSADWLPIDDVVRLTGDPIRTLRWRCVTKWSARGKAELRPPASGNGKPSWWISRSVDRRLLADAPSADLAASLLSRHPRRHVERAHRKAQWLAEWRSRCNYPREAGLTDRAVAEQIIAEARRVEGADFAISVRSLQLWSAAFDSRGVDGNPLGVAALIDQYGRRESTIVNGQSPISRSAEAVAYFYSLYRTENKLSVTTCHGFTLRESSRRGWSWPPSYSATLTWLRDHDDVAFSYVCRYGLTAYNHRFTPYMEQDWSVIAPGQFFVSDHTECDFWVRHRDKLIRPWLTTVQDCGSRCIVGWHLGASPHQESILLALRMAFREYGVPQTLRVDNGKDFKSRAITGLTKDDIRALRQQYGKAWHDVIRRDRSLLKCDDSRWLGVVPELGVKLIFATPYNPQSKGTQERWYKTFEDQCAKLVVTYCGNEPNNRPECLEQLKPDAPTLEQARDHVRDYLPIYHAAPHRGLGMNGRSPLRSWNAHNVARRADLDALAFLVSVRGAYKVGPNGVAVQVAGMRVGYGASCAALRRYVGRDVLVAVDLERPAECFAFEADGRRLIARLLPNERMHPEMTTEDLRLASAAKARATRTARQAEAASHNRTRTAVQEANRHRQAQLQELRATGTDGPLPAATSGVIRPVRTGFEGASKPVRIEVVDHDAGDLSDLFVDRVSPEEESSGDDLAGLCSLWDTPKKDEDEGDIRELL